MMHEMQGAQDGGGSHGPKERRISDCCSKIVFICAWREDWAALVSETWVSIFCIQDRTCVWNEAVESGLTPLGLGGGVGVSSSELGSRISPSSASPAISYSVSGMAKNSRFLLWLFVQTPFRQVYLNESNWALLMM